MIKLQRGLSLACVVSLVAMIGCQVKPPAAAGGDEASLNLGGNGRVAGPAQPGGTNAQPGGQPGAGQAQPGGTTAGQPGSTLTTGGQSQPLAAGELPQAKVSGTPSRAEVLSRVPSMAVTAAMGGLYKSGDGRLQAVIPPDALTGDAEVKFAAVGTSELQANAVMTPGIMFAMDLGGVGLKDGAAILVKSKVDPRFVEEFQRSAPGKDPASAGLSQENGEWYLTMPVKAISGPNAEHLQANHIQDSLATVEMQPAPATYGLQLAQNDVVADGGGGTGGGSSGPIAAATASPSPSPAPTAAPTPVPTPTPVPKLPTTSTDDADVNGWDAMTQAQKDSPSHKRVNQMVVRALGHDVTLQMKNDRNATLGTADKSEYIQCFIGHGWCAGGTIYDTIDGTIKFNKGVDSNHLPPLGLTQAVNAKRSGSSNTMDWDCTAAQTLVDVKVKAVYKSDDLEITGDPANDATITRAANGVSMAEGKQAELNFKVGLGVAFSVYGSINKPEFSQSESVSSAGAVGMSAITIEIPKMSPKIVLNLTADAKLPSSVSVEYLLGTDKRTETLPIPTNAEETASVSFRALVPNDDDHQLKLTRVFGSNFDDDGAPDMNIAFPVHRNQTYGKNVRLKLNAPK